MDLTVSRRWAATDFSISRMSRDGPKRSTLVATTTTGPAASSTQRRASLRSSASTRPTDVSTNRQTTSASRVSCLAAARRALRSTVSVSFDEDTPATRPRLFLDPPLTPAVSTRTTDRPLKVIGHSTGSRVAPGIDDDKAISCPASRFSNDDFPTFGRPTNASLTAVASSSALRAAASFSFSSSSGSSSFPPVSARAWAWA
mmetsp:Transcript_8281/g.27135  ORF Transcript_8281/g.27135 Transcript_8281/m.27135 type:complete len:201 (-) Transcript_8281:1454-2056(-)